jgi:hypothetical protein
LARTEDEVKRKAAKKLGHNDEKCDDRSQQKGHMVNKPSRTKEVATGSGVIFFFQGTTILRKLCVEGTP